MNAYYAAISLLEATDNQPFRKTYWDWQLQGTADAPVIQLQWSIEIEDDGNIQTFSASAPTFEQAVKKLAARFRRHDAAKKTGLALNQDESLQMQVMEALEGCTIRLMNIQADGDYLYEVDGDWPDGTGLTVGASCFEDAEKRLAAEAIYQNLTTPDTGLRDPVRFWEEWRFLEKLPLFCQNPAAKPAWRSGSCLQMAAMVNPATGMADPEEPASNTELRIFLQCRYPVFDGDSWITAHDRAYDAAGFDFEDAVHRFVEKLQSRTA